MHHPPAVQKFVVDDATLTHPTQTKGNADSVLLCYHKTNVYTDFTLSGCSRFLEHTREWCGQTRTSPYWRYSKLLFSAIHPD